MTDDSVEYRFTYHAAERAGTRSVQFSKRPEQSGNQEGWRQLLLQRICREIGKAEPDLVLKTPNGWFDDASVQPEKGEVYAHLLLSVDDVPELTPDPDKYYFVKRVE